MHKRSAESKINHYKEKIRKLQDTEGYRRIRQIVSTSDSSDDESYNNGEVTYVTATQLSANEPLVEEFTEGHVNTLLETVDTAKLLDEAPVEELDADILIALGSETNDGPEYGAKIHENLANLWAPLLKKGLPREEKNKILKDHLVPLNCPLLQAPKLNPEISAAITDNSRNRDKKLVSSQKQLGVGITAINRGMDLLLTKEFDKIKVIKHLSDACRILSDLHHTETQARIKLITPSLDKKFINIIQDTCRDETLFGNKLSEKIKASKAIEKQGLQIKKTFVNSAVPSTSTAPRPTQSPGNWEAPLRYPSMPNRGGRGGLRGPTSNRKPAVAPPAQAKQSTKPQTRAQTQHPL